MRHSITLILLSFCLISTFSCKDESTFADPIDEFGYDYFPLEIGKHLTYKVDSILYDPINDTQSIADTNSIYIKEIVVDTFRDDLDQLNYRLERYERPDFSVDWVLKDVWSALRVDTKAERFEENLRFVKMIFPVTVGDLWDGNHHFDETTLFPVRGESVEIFKGWQYEVISMDEIDQIGDLTFNNVMHIQQANEENLIEIRYSIEKYARGIGLVYRRMIILNTQEIDPNIPWADKAETGFYLTKTLVDHN